MVDGRVVRRNGVRFLLVSWMDKLRGIVHFRLRGILRELVLGRVSVVSVTEAIMKYSGTYFARQLEKSQNVP